MDFTTANYLPGKKAVYSYKAYKQMTPLLVCKFTFNSLLIPYPQLSQVYECSVIQYSFVD